MLRNEKKYQKLLLQESHTLNIDIAEYIKEMNKRVFHKDKDIKELNDLLDRAPTLKSKIEKYIGADILKKIEDGITGPLTNNLYNARAQNILKKYEMLLKKERKTGNAIGFSIGGLFLIFLAIAFSGLPFAWLGAVVGVGFIIFSGADLARCYYSLHKINNIAKSLDARLGLDKDTLKLSTFERKLLAEYMALITLKSYPPLQDILSYKKQSTVKVMETVAAAPAVELKVPSPQLKEKNVANEAPKKSLDLAYESNNEHIPLTRKPGSP